MKLSGVIEISDRQVPLLCSGPKRRPTTALLTIGYEPGRPNVVENVSLLVCTPQNKTGTKYKIYDNVETIFSKFEREGLATIRLLSPPHDVLIKKADPLTLKSFLKILRIVVAGIDGLARYVLSKLGPATAAQVQAPRIKLEVIGPDQWRKSLSNGLARSLQLLSITDCQLRDVDRRILRLPALRELILSRNEIAELPAQLGNLALHLLALVENRLTSLPVEVIATTTRLGASLSRLDLRDNRLTALPEALCDVSTLCSLRLDGNEIAELPKRLGTLRLLRTLTASNNRLAFLPLSAKLLRLDTIDVSENPFRVEGGCCVQASEADPVVPTLLELTCRNVIAHRIKFDEGDLPHHLVRVIAGHQVCPCGRPFLQSSSWFRGEMDLRTIASTVTWTYNYSRIVPIEGFLCRRSCM